MAEPTLTEEERENLLTLARAVVKCAIRCERGETWCVLCRELLGSHFTEDRPHEDGCAYLLAVQCLSAEGQAAGYDVEEVFG